MTKRSRVIPPAVRRAVLERDGYACTDCGATLRLVNPHLFSPVINLQLHHKIEFENGGEHTSENLVTLCTKCHYKHDEEYRRARQAKAAAERRAKARELGFICLTDAAEQLGISGARLGTLLWRNGIQTVKKREFDRMVLIPLADFLKLREPRAEAA